jgi:hypothetical protein
MKINSLARGERLYGSLFGSMQITFALIFKKKSRLLKLYRKLIHICDGPILVWLVAPKGLGFDK